MTDIESYEGELRWLRARIQEVPKLCAEIDEAAAEIERLRAVLITVRDRATVHMGDYEVRIDGEELETFIARALEPKP